MQRRGQLYSVDPDVAGPLIYSQINQESNIELNDYLAAAKAQRHLERERMLERARKKQVLSTAILHEGGRSYTVKLLPWQVENPLIHMIPHRRRTRSVWWRRARRIPAFPAAPTPPPSSSTSLAWTRIRVI